MRSRSRQIKSQNKVYFCKLCSFVTESEEELENHYALEHEEDNDINYELEIIFANRKTTKDLKSKAIKQLKLITEGKSYHDEYLGTCLQRYYIGRIDNAIILLPYATLC